MSRGHDHGTRASRRHLRPMTVAFGLIVVFMVVEGIVAWWSGSLALLSDAGHMATDALGLGMALAAIVAADRSRRGGRRTYGLYRAEILAALGNAVALFVIAGLVLFEAVARLSAPPDVLTTPMLVVALGGLVVNVVAWRLLRHGAAESLNVAGAYLEVVADLIGSVGVLAAGAVIAVTGWTIVDPLVAAAIGFMILPRAWQLGRRALEILVQAAPKEMDLAGLSSQLSGIPGVVDVHDLHVWTLTSDMEVATAHLMTGEGVDPHPVLDRAQVILRDHGVAHATLQVEPESHEGCAELSW